MLPSPPKAIWTIGHSNRSFEEFAGLLEAHQITLLCDVRRYPGSKRYPHFSAEDLSKTLSLRNIGYVHLANLGGRREPQQASGNTAWRNKAFQGYADYMETPLFTSAIYPIRSHKPPWIWAHHLFLAALSPLDPPNDLFNGLQILGQPVERLVNLLLCFLIAKDRNGRMDLHQFYRAMVASLLYLGDVNRVGHGSIFPDDERCLAKRGLII